MVNLRVTYIIVVGIPELVGLGQRLVGRASICDIISTTKSVCHLSTSVQPAPNRNEGRIEPTSCKVVPPRTLREATVVPLQRLLEGTSLKKMLQ